MRGGLTWRAPRAQTVEERAEPLYYRLIQAFFRLTGVPMVLNTSFNTLPKEPITETPSDAIRSFLHVQGAIHTLVGARDLTSAPPLFSRVAKQDGC